MASVSAVFQFIEGLIEFWDGFGEMFVAILAGLAILSMICFVLSRKDDVDVPRPGSTRLFS